MTLDFLIPFAIAVLVVAGVTALLTVGAAAEFLARHRPIRMARHESIPAYYGGLIGVR
ncbi:hypothetical protein [Nocardioides piscis]|uniref:Uncharacterized protein n=1 Tax=Nocardioides piscis TaxID=2714938 RepID=A0A6G7YK48_9ACTN|nr:hypothetical protein [Nocardioides piscis]QIK77123.1 hypothetical protein G7071_18465 [Nocardioides piscis]